MPSRNFGYRCPDVLGYCPTEWIPSPEGTSDLRTPSSYSHASSFNRGNTNVQRISGAGIGNAEILALRPIDAVDVWGDGATGGGEVCFVGEGRILFVDTVPLERTQTYLSTTMRGDNTCAQISGPGQVIFLPPNG